VIDINKFMTPHSSDNFIDRARKPAAAFVGTKVGTV
jgi:hypothetical protein